MNRGRRPLVALATIAIAALISACGSSAPASTGADHENGVKFADCMRANGVSGFPDPGASGSLTLDGVVNGSSLNPNTPAWKRAIGACKDLEPAGFTGSPRTTRGQGVALKFAECIRQNGVPDFPDPTPNGPLIDTNRIPSTATASGMSALHAATRKCASYAAELGVGRQ
jgi:hypothetical protein